MEGAEKAAGTLRKASEAQGQADCARDFGQEQAKRDARFDELPIEGKIMRLRDAMLSLAVMAERASNQAGEANRIAKVHDHGSGGQVVVPIDEPGNRALSLMGDVEAPFRRIQRLLG